MISAAAMRHFAEIAGCFGTAQPNRLPAARDGFSVLGDGGSKGAVDAVTG